MLGIVLCWLLHLYNAALSYHALSEDEDGDRNEKCKVAVGFA